MNLRKRSFPVPRGSSGSLLTMTRANASFDGKRFRFRFPLEDEEDPMGGDRQPIIEREDDPIYDPEVFNLVTAPWAVGETLLGKVWCAEVRLGRPSVEMLRELERQNEIEEEIEEVFEDFEPERLPLFVDPDGTSEWATFVLTGAERGTDIWEMEEDDRARQVIEVIVEGATGLAWLQRPLYEEEIDLFEERGWPVLLRQDFLDPRVLTEEDVLELRDIPLD